MNIKTEMMMYNSNSIIQVPEKLKSILDQNETLSVQIRGIAIPFSEILKANDLYFFPEFTDHGIKHIEKTLKYAENLIAEDTNLTAEEVGVMLLSIVLHDIGMHTNAEMFKNMIDGKYDDLVDLFPNGKTWKELWKDFLYDSEYWGEEKKKNVFGSPDYNRHGYELSDLQKLNEYDRKLIGEFIRIHHCRIAHEVSIKGYIGRKTIPFECEGINPIYLKIAGIVARSHGMDVRDTFSYLKGLSGRINNISGIHVVYLMVLLRLADYLQIDSSRTNEFLLNINTLYSPYSQLEHKTHLSIETVEFINTDKEKIDIQAYPKNAQTYVKIEKLAEDIQKELDRSWAILGEVYPDYNYKLRYRRITTNISDENYKDNLKYVPQQFCFRYNNDLFKLLITPLYGDNPSYGVRELVQNAVDACRLCINELPTGVAHVKVEVDTKKSLFTITDMGKGMNLHEIGSYFLTIGSSYNENIDWKKNRDRKQIYRTGRFGIGVLAAFLLGSEITVITKKRGEKEGGYMFTASLNDKYIQIEKEPNAEYGTKIEIQCNEACIEYLGNDYINEWYQWYIGNNPIVEYYIDGKPRNPRFDLKNYKLLNHSSPKFGPVYWKPRNLNPFNDSSELYCNDFLISHRPSKTNFSLIGFDEFTSIRIPNLQITDLYNQLPLNLQRNDIEVNAKYDFEPELAKEVFVDIMCQLMAKDLNSIDRYEFEMFNIHFDGFTLQSKYIKNCVKEKGVIYITSSHHSRNSFMFNGLAKLLKKHKVFDHFICSDNNELANQFRYDLSNLPNKEQILIKQKEFLYQYFNGYFAVLDYKTEQENFLKQHFREVLYLFEGWIIFAPSDEWKDLIIDIIHFGKNSIRYILIKDLQKCHITETVIDDMFEKYMHKDPVIPYEFEERKKKFPLLFHDYSEVIEQYKKKYE